MRLKILVVDLEMSKHTKRVAVAICTGIAATLAGTAALLADVPNAFSDGDVLSAEKITGNFSDLDARIAALQTTLGDTGEAVGNLEAQMAAVDSELVAIDGRLDAHTTVGVVGAQSPALDLANGTAGQVCTDPCPAGSQVIGGECLSTGCGVSFGHPCPGFNLMSSTKCAGESWCCEFNNASGALHSSFTRRVCLRTDVADPL
jgi:hypothetical protein